MVWSGAGARLPGPQFPRLRNGDTGKRPSGGTVVRSDCVHACRVQSNLSRAALKSANKSGSISKSLEMAAEEKGAFPLQKLFF